jgi:CubicO group peptidase (beta-lactamase class C family)
VFSTPFSILNQAIAARAFPAASVAITQQGRLIALKAFGGFGYGDESAENKPVDPAFLPRPSRDDGKTFVAPSTLFDIASVSKVVATTSMAMVLYERGMLDLDARLSAAVPELITGPAETLDSRRGEITLRMLLAHSSGLPAHEKFFLKATNRDQILAFAFAIPLSASPGSRAEYSDIGFILLGIALERMAGLSLNLFCQREIFSPLGMTHTLFNPSPELRSEIPPTADERPRGPDHSARANSKALEVPGADQMVRSAFRGKLIQGEVQDENAFVMGGVAGHAGVFASAEDLAKFAHAMLSGGHPIFRPETVALFIRREPAQVGTSRALGWDTPSSPSQSGKYLSAASFGHLGYTGTSLWIDPERQLSVTLLTNRTWPNCRNQAIRQVRPQFHDAVIEALDRA